MPTELGNSGSLPSASELGMSGIFAGAYDGSRAVTEETIRQMNSLRGYAESQATNIEGVVEGILAASQVDLPEMPNFGTAISLQGTLADLPAAPDEPAIDDLPDEFSVPDFEPSVDGSIDVSGAPTLDASAPNISFSARPVTGQVSVPSAVPEPDFPDRPVEPDYAVPGVPSLRSLTLPTVPTLDIPVFSSVAPEYDIEDPETEFAWTDPAYQTTFVAALTEKLTSMLDGNLGLSAEIEAAIWGQARDRDAVVAFASEREAFEDFAARGFTMPSGSLAARVDAVRQAKHNAAGETSRTIAIESAKLRIEGVKFAVVQCSALEQLLWQIHNASVQRQYEAAKAALDFRIAVFNALIQAFQAKQQAYATEAQVFRDRIQGELARLEVYRTELEGQKLIGELNLQDVEVYKAQLSSINVLADIYRTSVTAYSAQMEGEAKKIDVFRAQLEAAKVQLEAEGLEVDAWSKGMQGEAIKANVYESQVRAFSAEMQGFSTVKGLQLEGLKVANDSLGVQYQAYQSKLSHQGQMASQALQRIQQQVSVADMRIRKYGAELDFAKAEIGTDLEARKLDLQIFSTEVEKEIKQVEYSLQRAKFLADIVLEAQKAIAQVRSQIAAQAMGAVRASMNADAKANIGASGSYTETNNLNA